MHSEPDLNPIEHVWAFMKCRIEKNHPKNSSELKIEILSAWEAITIEILNNCIDHVHKTILEVIAKNGGF